MSLRLLIDEDTQARALVRLLREAGHDVVTVGEAGLSQKDDDDVLAFARREDRQVLTRNAEDFRVLHQADPQHPGILVLFEDKDTTKNLTYDAICNAIASLEASGWDLSGQFIGLNAWNFKRHS